MVVDDAINVDNKPFIGVCEMLRLVVYEPLNPVPLVVYAPHKIYQLYVISRLKYILRVVGNKNRREIITPRPQTESFYAVSIS